MKKQLWMVLAALTIMASCNKQDDLNDVSGDKINVSLKITKNPISRSALEGSVAEGAITALESGTLYFFGSDNVLKHTHALTNEDITASSPANGAIIIKDVPSTVTKVAMIGNAALTGTISSVTTFQSATLTIAPQNAMAANLATGAAPAAVKGIALLDDAGNTVNLNALTAATNPADIAEKITHTVAINLTPAVARLEIAADALTIINSPTHPDLKLAPLSSFTFGGYYLNNFLETRALNLTSSAPWGGSGLWATITKGLYATTYSCMADGGKAAPIALTGGATAGVAYHVFPGAVPHIIIEGRNFEYGSEAALTDTEYWLIDEYVNEAGGGVINAFEAGKVYKISSIKVGDTYPRKEPYDEPLRVKATVTVTSWSVVNVSVTPK